MSLTVLGWIILLLAGLYSLLFAIELWQGETNAMKHHGFFESVGGEKLHRKSEPLRFWLNMCLRGVGGVCLWVLWYLCWFAD